MTSQGHLNPGPDATISRHAPPTDICDAVVHFWVPEWNLPPGQTSRQMVLSYPVLNLVIQPDAPEGSAALYGPRTTVSSRVLTGRGWALGALLKPAALPAMLDAAGGTVSSARPLVDSWLTLDQSELVTRIAAAMESGAAQRQQTAVAILADWIRARMAAVGAPDRDGLLANAVLDLVEALPSTDAARQDREQPTHVSDAARRLGASTRTLERVTLKYTGLTPAALIRRTVILLAAISSMVFV